MLTKLLKRDFQATVGTFLPTILGFVIVGILTKILFEVGVTSTPYNDSYVSDTNESMVVSSVIFLVLYFTYIVAFFIMTFVFIVSDFCKTMAGKQACLTHTLSVKANTLIASKLIITIFWWLVVCLLVFSSFLLFLVGHMPQIPWPEVLTDLDMTLGMTMGKYTSFMIACIIIGTFSSPLIFYASITTGHLFDKYKIMGAILSYLGIYTVVQIIYTVVMTAFGYSFTSTLIRTSAMDTNFYSSFLNSYIWFATIFSIITSVIFYFITNFVMSKKPNLE